jgi:hypothetical protein
MTKKSIERFYEIADKFKVICESVRGKINEKGAKDVE